MTKVDVELLPGVLRVAIHALHAIEYYFEGSDFATNL